MSIRGDGTPLRNTDVTVYTGSGIKRGRGGSKAHQTSTTEVSGSGWTHGSWNRCQQWDKINKEIKRSEINTSGSLNIRVSTSSALSRSTRWSTIAPLIPSTFGKMALPVSIFHGSSSSTSTSKKKKMLNKSKNERLSIRVCTYYPGQHVAETLPR